MGNWIVDRLLGRTNEPVLPPPPPPPQQFCSKCGQPMVDGYMVLGHEYSVHDGSPVKRIIRNRMCIALHGKDRPQWVSDEDGEGHYPGADEHDGFPGWGWYSNYQTDIIPDCQPRKAVK